METHHKEQLQALEEADRIADVNSKSDAEEKIDDVLKELNRLERAERNLKQILYTILAKRDVTSDALVEEAKRISKVRQYPFHKLDKETAKDRSWDSGNTSKG